MRKNSCMFVLLAACLFLIISGSAWAGQKLLVFCGASLKLPMDEIVEAYEKQSGVGVDVSYGGVGSLLSQITLSKRGDLFVVPSPDIMDKARERGFIVGGSVKDMAFVAPAINITKGNSKGIKSLRDLTRPGIRVAIGNPETVFAGMLAVEIIDRSLPDREARLLRKNIVTYAEDFNKLATLLVLGQVDAIVGYNYLDAWYPDKIETVKLNANEIWRIGAEQAALLSFSTDRTAAGSFLNYLVSDKSRAVFRKYHYFGDMEEAQVWVGGKKPVGGKYALPDHWAGAR